ncbi:MAG: rane protein [Propionibacteriaceae bacterium]|nr:rane protein [Propionibacteriaceae bacterium]
MTSIVSTQEALTWAPRPELAAVGWVFTAVAVAAAVFLDDPPGQVLLGTVAVVSALLSLFATVARPRLAADNRGVTVRGLTGSRHWSWGEVNVRLTHTRRLGRDVAAVEVDAENAEVPALVILGRLDLGADPEDVVAALLELRT